MLLQMVPDGLQTYSYILPATTVVELRSEQGCASLDGQRGSRVDARCRANKSFAFGCRPSKVQTLTKKTFFLYWQHLVHFLHALRSVHAKWYVLANATDNLASLA